MEIKDIKAVYFVGAGGIGMSAIARYFLSKKLVVAGYDKTPSNLTHELEKEGMLIHYEENVDLIPEACKDAKTTLVVYTPKQFLLNTRNWFSSMRMDSPSRSELRFWVH